MKLNRMINHRNVTFIKLDGRNVKIYKHVGKKKAQVNKYKFRMRKDARQKFYLQIKEI